MLITEQGNKIVEKAAVAPQGTSTEEPSIEPPGPSTEVVDPESERLELIVEQEQEVEALQQEREQSAEEREEETFLRVDASEQNAPLTSEAPTSVSPATTLPTETPIEIEMVERVEVGDEVGTSSPTQNMSTSEEEGEPESNAGGLAPDRDMRDARSSTVNADVAATPGTQPNVSHESVPEAPESVPSVDEAEGEGREDAVMTALHQDATSKTTTPIAATDA